jgi:F420-dependent oxidoreductase-like protein
MRIGLHIGKFDWVGSPDNIGEKLAEIAKAADENGFYSLWVMDHLFQLGTQYGTVHGPVKAAMLEGYSTIAYLAALTRRIKVGLMVTCNFFREPGLLIKTASTIDILSGGRTYFGIGAGWFEREAKGLGFSFPPLKERFERLEETLQIAKQMWQGDMTPYNGKYYHLVEPINNPQPLSKPHPPIMIGGEGEKKTLWLVAKYADASNFAIGTTLKEAGVLYKEDTEERQKTVRTWILGKLEVLIRHCKEVGRPYSDIEKTLTTYIKLAPDAMNTIQVIELCHRLATTGIQHVIFNMPNAHEIEPIKIIGQKIIPQVTDL